MVGNFSTGLQIHILILVNKTLSDTLISPYNCMMKGFIRGDETFNLLEVEKVECPDGIFRYKETGSTDKFHEIEDLVIKESDQILVVNSKNVPINISHFQGTSRERVAEFMDIVKLNSALTLPKDLTIVTTFTDPNRSILYQQLQSNGIDCINTCDYMPDDGEWSMVKKINLIREGLKHVDTELALICDGYDVYINTFDNLVPRFKKTGLRMLYNSTKNNFPWTHVDKVPYRDWRGDYRYFNAGCAIGYVEDFKKFYDDCANIISEVSNPWESEQFILRCVFAKYSEKVDTPEAYMDFDWKCELFQTYVNAVVLRLYENQQIYAVI